MNNYCPNCGTKLEEGSKFCSKCGTNVDGTSTTNNTTVINNNYYNTSNVIIEKRDIAIAVILSLVTCGIYGIYWFIKMTDEANSLSNETNASGALAFVYTLLTCGIYQIYWYYKMGKNMQKAGNLHGVQVDDNAIVYLLLGIFGLGIVSYCLIQNDINKFAKN